MHLTICFWITITQWCKNVYKLYVWNPTLTNVFGLVGNNLPFLYCYFIFLSPSRCLLTYLSVPNYPQMAEYRISIYGRKQSEWDQLASWIVNNDLYSENVVWLIQVCFIYLSTTWIGFNFHNDIVMIYYFSCFLVWISSLNSCLFNIFYRHIIRSWTMLLMYWSFPWDCQISSKIWGTFSCFPFMASFAGRL